MNWKTTAHQELNTRLTRAIGGRTASEFEKMGLLTVGDLLQHCPRRYVGGTEMSDFRSLMVDDEVALIAQVHRTEHAFGKAKQRLKVTLTDGRRNYISATFFADKDYLIRHWQKVLPVGARGIFVGKVGEFNGALQLAHPDFVVLGDGNQIVAGRNGEREKALVRQTQRDALVGIYPATRALPTWVIADSIALVMDNLGRLPDPLPEPIRRRGGAIELGQAFEAVHAPATMEQAERGLHRLRFGEGLGAQLLLAYRRAERQKIGVKPIKGGELLAAFDAQLPFELTGGQKQVSEEIFADLARTFPMSRLLQGEVGSGKTVIALRTMIAAVDAGSQAVLLAPTEVLAKQHFRTILDMLGDLGSDLAGVEVDLLTASRSSAAKRGIQDRLAAGQPGITIGTHALLSQGIEFGNLGLVVVDEQHRFGVEQRAALSAKAGTEPHTLVMTATPIPRSVAMTIFGDLDVSTLRELPLGRAEVKTVFVNTEQQPRWVSRAWERAKEEVAEGRQVFIVCPRIDAQDTSSRSDAGLEDAADERVLSSVVALAQELSAGPLAGLGVGIAHGRQPATERDQVMADFVSGKLDVLVSTTVVEVGVDVPNASMMIIVDADRFGLSQLHQLRGRIGRGSHPGLCLLLAPLVDPSSPAARRLEALTLTRDGFELAETDLELRREGNVLGTEQSGGSSGLRLLRVLEDVELIKLTKKIAVEVVEADPEAEQPWVRDSLRTAAAAGEWADRS